MKHTLKLPVIDDEGNTVLPVGYVFSTDEATKSDKGDYTLKTSDGKEIVVPASAV